MAEGPQERPGATKPQSGERAGWLTRLLNRLAPEVLEGQGTENLPSSLAPLRQLSLINLKSFGIMAVCCEEPLDSTATSQDVYDHPWTFLRIRLTGNASEKVLDGAMCLSDRMIPRIQIIKATDFVGRAVSRDQAWVLLLRGAVTKGAGRLGGVRDGQAAYVEEVFCEKHSGMAPSSIVVDE